MERIVDSIYYGTHFDSLKVAIMNSHQSKTILGNDIWVKKSFEAVNHSIEQNYTVLTSTGISTYEFLIWATSVLCGKQIIVHPASKDEDYQKTAEILIDDFHIDTKRTAFVFLPSKFNKKDIKKTWKARDSYIFASADRIYPVCVKDNGQIASLLENCAGKIIVDDFRCNYQSKHYPNKEYNYESIDRKYPKEEWHYLTHWVHCTYKPWRGESSYDFYGSIYNSKNEYSHSAKATLSNILINNKIFATSSNIREHFEVVSFTELSPAESLSMMKWRKRKVMYNFEPFGIALNRRYASEIGMKPAIYGDDVLYLSLSQQERALFQAIGDRYDWRNEKEWRHVGDIDLSLIPKDMVKIIVPMAKEAEMIEEFTDFEVITLCD